jgi:hypothetical protein
MQRLSRDFDDYAEELSRRRRMYRRQQERKEAYTRAGYPDIDLNPDERWKDYLIFAFGVSVSTICVLPITAAYTLLKALCMGLAPDIFMFPSNAIRHYGPGLPPPNYESRENATSHSKISAVNNAEYRGMMRAALRKKTANDHTSLSAAQNEEAPTSS